MKKRVCGITDGGDLTTLAFRQLPYIGSFILVIGIITFAYSTILGWCYYGERCVEYLFGRKVHDVKKTSANTVKIGVGEKPKGWDLADYVLSTFPKEDREKVEEAMDHAVEAVRMMLDGEMRQAHLPVP